MKNIEATKLILKIAAMDKDNKTSVTLNSQDAKKILDYINDLEEENTYLKNKNTDDEEIQIYKK